MRRHFFISLFERTFKMMKNGVYFIVSQCGYKVMTMWIQSDDIIWDICASTKSTGVEILPG